MTKSPTFPPGLGIRTRARADATVRVWWEPSRTARAKGFEPVELDENRMTWSVRQARALTKKARTAAAAPSQGRTLSALIKRYMASTKFEELSAVTRTDYAKAFAILDDTFGKQLVGRISKAAVFDFYETRRRSAPASATALVRRLSLLMAHAELIEWRADGSNPCARLNISTPAPRKRVATWDEIAALLQASGSLVSVGCAIAMAVYTAQRQTDILGAQRDAITDDLWILRRSKRGNVGALPIAPHLAPWIQAAAAASEARGCPELLAYEPTGKPFLADTFRTAFRSVRRLAADVTPSVGTLQFRDLRRTAAVMARAESADALAVADMLGNTADRNPRLSETYMPPSAEAAARAIAGIQPPGFAQILPPPQPITEQRT